MNSHRRLARMLRTILLTLMIITVPALGAETPIIAIVSSQQAKPYQQTVASFKATLKQAHPGVEFIQADAKANEKALPAPALVFALGSRAVRESVTTLPDRDLLATMILNDKALQDSPRATAVLLKTSARKQLQWHRRILPKAKRIGILYDPKINQKWVDEARTAATKQGLEIIAVPVTSGKKLPSALKLLGRKADSILGIADKTVYSSKTAKAVLLYSFRNRIPFIGLSSAWVKAGALYALDWDYPDLGRQCAAIAVQILNGDKTGLFKHQLPDQQVYLLNLKTAKQMKLDLSQELIDGASRVYE